MELSELEAGLAAQDLAADPDRWAVAAFRLALAKSELANSRDTIGQCLDLLGRAARILTAERAPLEHSRIQTAIGNCHRASGHPERAEVAFGVAAELVSSRGEPIDVAAALINVGLAQAEQGRGHDAITTLDRAVSVLHTVKQRGDHADSVTDPGSEWARTLGAALVNRAQAHQASGRDGGARTKMADRRVRAAEGAVVDYRAALEVLTPDSPQAAMAWHGLGTAQLELSLIGPAISSFERSLAIFTATSFPFQHAIARHSLAIALDRRSREEGGGQLDLARAVHHLEATLGIFDPRLHPAQWRAAAESLARLEARAEGSSRTEIVVGLLSDRESIDERERLQVLRDRLGRLANGPTHRADLELREFCRVVTDLDSVAYRTVIEALMMVLMELPEAVLESACRAIGEANGDDEDRNRDLDEAIQQRLFGPQRVRVRDLLSAHGWIRP